MRRGSRLILLTLALAGALAAPVSGSAGESRGTIGRAQPTTVAAVPGAATAPTRVAVGERPVVALAPQLSGDDAKVRFALDLDRPVPVSAFVLAEPYRVVVDLPEVVFPAGTGGKPAAALVASWRAGLFMTGRSRIVFDTAGPTRVSGLAVVPRPGGGARLELTVEAVTRAAFKAGALISASGPAGDGAARVDAPLAKADREPLRGSVAGADDARRVIVLDPGHGGIDPGTRSPATGLVEKTVVLEFAKLFKQKLEATGHYTVHLTRDDDTFIPLAERVRIARRLHADVFVSVHADAEYDHSVRGATVYTVADKGSDDKSEALAAKENASDAVAGVVPEDSVDEVADILLDLTRRETRLLNQTLAGAMVHGLGQVGKLVGGTGQRAAGFRVLKAYDVPSVLIEIGFITNKDDEAQMTSHAWRERMAAALVGAVDRYFADRVAGGR